MDEALYFYARSVVYDLDFFQRKLPCRHYSGYSQISQICGASCTGNSHLCACMYGKKGKIRSDEREHPQILNNDRIQSPLIEGSQILKKTALQFSVLKQGIHGKIQFFLMYMGIIYSLCHSSILQVIGVCPGSEILPADVNGIRSCQKCRFHALPGSCRR